MGIPTALVLKLISRSPTPNFVESGTFYGGTTYWAAKHFKRVVTIEINPELSNRVSSKPDCPSNIEFHVGSSPDILPAIAPTLQGPTVFWLDAHYCGTGTGDTSDECPILAELNAISQVKDAYIFIDDARYFLGPPPPPHDPGHWVGIDTIFRTLAMHHPNHATTIHDDVIICVPNRVKDVLDADWLEQYDTRYVFKPQPLSSRLRAWGGKVLRRLHLR